MKNTIKNLSYFAYLDTNFDKSRYDNDKVVIEQLTSFNIVKTNGMDIIYLLRCIKLKV